MAEPKKKSTRTSGRLRRTQQKLNLLKLTKCPKCKTPIPPHRLCPVCGTYKSVQAPEVKPIAKKKKAT